MENISMILLPKYIAVYSTQTDWEQGETGKTSVSYVDLERQNFASKENALAYALYSLRGKKSELYVDSDNEDYPLGVIRLEWESLTPCGLRRANCSALAKWKEGKRTMYRSFADIIIRETLDDVSTTPLNVMNCLTWAKPTIKLN